MARPSRLIELVTIDGVEMTVGDQIVSLLDIGLDFTSAAKAAGVGRSTLNQWKHRGTEALDLTAAGGVPDVADLPYADFMDAVGRARARTEAKYLSVMEDAATCPQTITRTIVKKALNADGELVVIEETTTTEIRPPSWGAAAWRLERGWPNKHGRRIEVTDSTEDRTSSEIARDLADDLRAFQMGAEARADLDAQRDTPQGG